MLFFFSVAASCVNVVRMIFILTYDVTYDVYPIISSKCSFLEASKMAASNKRNRRGKDDAKHDAENLQRTSRQPADLSSGNRAAERDGSASGMDPAHHSTGMYRHHLPGPYGAASAHHNYNPAYPMNHSSGGQHNPYARPNNPPQGQTQVENKKASFEQFLEQLREFFSMIGAWYGVSGPIVLHYLREQILVR